MSDSRNPTPPPWSYQDCMFERPVGRLTKSCNLVITASDKDPIVATVWGHSVSTDRCLANARLIAASFDLLNACLAMLGTWGGQDEEAIIKARDMAASAVSKALDPTTSTETTP